MDPYLVCAYFNGGDVKVLEEAESGRVRQRSLHQLSLQIFQIPLDKFGLWDTHTI